ncbi:uncharacterized protein MONBRDRAFT_10030 [Monosiga brevicollis MX1]|uniref:2-amino-3-ketobutyrate coenzyme A ligase, mitochondrial n=1 Tax=Monosiga brevicollis TaxID=81824 RepID=A9V4Z6_MONBE|nr:uncharacterized protein MONBRDRAFT_10030 [Monosiga brevicollis MX1]EDQ87456.1 predicted protein [Monosiga brevicollis MX1]|eukprot:XP_001747716.1 hypothetical protein [Monosiga brevicollis MX1]
MGWRAYGVEQGSRRSALDVVAKQLEEIEAAGTWKTERVITSTQAASINVANRSEPVLNFCANNYLGLANNPEVIAAGKAAMDTHGNGLASVRFICGTQDIHKNLEGLVAEFHEMEDTILYASCFDANAAIFETLLSPEDAVFSDELNHASIIDGIRLCKAQKARFRHRDMGHLREQLQEKKDARIKLIVTDGVFSMDGNIAPLCEICDLADEFDALVMIDECHATGFLGQRGRGTDELLGVKGRVDIINSTMGKALGGAMGGYTTGPKEVVALLRQKARPYLFSNTLPPAVVGATTKVFELLMSNSDLVEKVQANTQRFRKGMEAAGFVVGGDPEHPICPIMLGDARLASQFADEMLKENIYVIGFSFPVVPKGKARIRTQISAAHSEADIDRAIQAFRAVADRLNFDPANVKLD